MWDLIVSVPDNCLSFYFTKENNEKDGSHPKVDIFHL